MQSLKSKADVTQLMNQFASISEEDPTLNKRYFILDDRERGGVWTIMLYPDGNWTIHGKGDDYCDEGETAMSPEQLATFLWKNRAAVNKQLKPAKAS